MRIARLLALLLAALALSGPSRANAEVQVRVLYSETVNLYSLMDNVSGWLDGYTNPTYRQEWSARFGWTAADQVWADRYAEYRRRTFHSGGHSSDPRQRPDGLFASASELAADSDPLLQFLAGQNDVDSALSNLEQSVSRADARMLRGFYRHFAPGWRVILRESSPLANHAQALQRRFENQRLTDFLARVARYFRSEVDGTFRVYFTRQPPGRETSAEVVGGQLMMLHSPVNLPVEAGDWEGIVMHEFVHFISAGQPAEQKRALTEQFLSRCPMPAGVSPLWLLEEPLAVAWGQAAYASHVQGRPLDPNGNWYAIPWVNIVSRTLAPSVIAAYDNSDTINSIVDQAAERCVELGAIASQLNPQVQR